LKLIIPWAITLAVHIRGCIYRPRDPGWIPRSTTHSSETTKLTHSEYFK